jgi:hypothetical protein
MKNLHRFLLLSTLLLSLFLASCGGGGETGGGTETVSAIAIQTPSSEDAFLTDCNEVFLGGESDYPASQWSGVNLSWQNQTDHGLLSGMGQTSVDRCIGWFFGYWWYEDCNAGWWADIPLNIGSNTITVTAFDSNQNVVGQDKIIINKPEISFSIRGRITNIDGTGLFNMKVILDGSANYVYTDSNGYYDLKCLKNGVYHVYPDPEGYYNPGRVFFNYMDWPFTPNSSTVVVNDMDVSGEDFSTEVYEVSGRIINASGNGFENLDVFITAADGKKSSSRTGKDGFYALLVPNGIFTVQPSDNFSFDPPSRQVRVEGNGVYSQDFSSR